MYADAALHNRAGAWQMVFGLEVHPAYRRQGRAAALMQALIDQARAEGRRGVVLTCKAEKNRLLPKVLVLSTKGSAVRFTAALTWYQMRLPLV